MLKKLPAQQAKKNKEHILKSTIMQTKMVKLLLLFLFNFYSINAQLPDSTTLSKMVYKVKKHIFKEGVQEIISFDDLFDSKGNLKVAIKEEISRIYFDESNCYKIYLDYKTDTTANAQKYKEMYYQLVNHFQELDYHHIEVIDCKKQWQPYFTLYYEAYQIGYQKTPPANCFFIQIDVRDFKNNKCVPSEEYRIH